MARDSLQEFQQLRPNHAKISMTVRLVRWCPPPFGMVKINFDGTLFLTMNIVGFGIIVRNDRRLVMAALSKQIPLPTSVEMVEELTARRAPLFARELGFESLVIEGDLEIIINAINGGDSCSYPSLVTFCKTSTHSLLLFSLFLSRMLDA